MKSNPDQYSLFNNLDAGEKLPGDYKQELLPICDGGYFDALAAIGFAAVVHSYLDIDEADSPLIEWTPNGFMVSYANKPERAVPDLGWLRYSVAGAWRKGDKDKWKAHDNHTKKARGWDGAELINTDGAEIDVSQDPQITIPLGEGTILVTEPMRQLYGVANKLGSPEWFNLCVFACRMRGQELINGSFSEKSVPLNSVVLPQASKGASGSNSFSIGNTSLADTISTSLSRYTCLAVAGFIIAAKGQSPQKAVQGFAIPVPKVLRLETVKRISDGNRRRLTNGGFFFSYDNYLSFIKQLLIYKEDIGLSNEESSLFSIAGANFIPLGNSSSPSSSWQLVVPKHHYTIGSVDRLQNLLRKWRAVNQAGQNKTVSIDRAAVAKLMRGFEYSDPAETTSGYLDYVFDVGLNGPKNGSFYFLTQKLFEEIMAYKYQTLLDQLLGSEIKPFIDLVRQETYGAAFPPKGRDKTQPNYQMIRSLREVQNVDDFIKAITEIAIERGVSKIATANNDSSKTKYWINPYEPSLRKLIELAESKEGYSPKLLANLILSFALSKRAYEQVEGEEDAEKELETTLIDENED
ncbi:hypothetical protein [Fibrella aquatilis]|uniref:Uncharacterized protein n=1 Tax=Fibrella aquatilis TaxID=2817059 RepID=A0A939G6E0_9BACT|nr:hypothetical protein [Fibrella aquatilis]MBO0933004.1 hypothetical protein [Fibrella aquatilis]